MASKERSRRLVFLTNSMIAHYLNYSKTPTVEETNRGLSIAKGLLESDEERQPVVLNIKGEKVPAYGYKASDGNLIVVTDGFIGKLNKNGKITNLSPFTYFFK